MTSYGGIIRIRLRVEVDDFLSACNHKLPCIYFYILYHKKFESSIAFIKSSLYDLFLCRSVFAWGTSVMLFEGFRKVADAVKSDLMGNFRYG